MAEPGLGMSYTSYLAEVGVYLGIGASPTGDALTVAHRVMDSALRKFYGVHKWSFLNITTTLTTADEDFDYDLPDNFGHFIGKRMHFAADENYQGVEFTNVDKILESRSANDYNERPYCFAIRDKSTDQSASQKQEAIFYPEPDAAYVLTYTYRSLFEPIRSGTDYPNGNAEYSEVILGFMLAEAELKNEREKGVQHVELYGGGGSPGLLNSAIRRDASKQPTHLGSMGDESDRSEAWRQEKRYIDGEVLYS